MDRKIEKNSKPSKSDKGITEEEELMLIYGTYNKCARCPLRGICG
ncbi:MAG: hypothetical protein ABWW65_07875 [Thermoprotei archaeon]